MVDKKIVLGLKVIQKSTGRSATVRAVSQEFGHVILLVKLSPNSHEVDSVIINEFWSYYEENK